MPRRPKTLLEHLRDRTFRAERHGDLLLGEALPAEPMFGFSAEQWEGLRAEQRRYKRLPSPEEVEEKLEALEREWDAKIIELVNAGKMTYKEGYKMLERGPY
jgi:hypothetical protein